MTSASIEYARQHIKELQAEYEANVLSVNALAAKYNMHEATLRKWVKKHGWVRIDAEARREVVNAGLRGEQLPQAPEGDDAAKRMLEAAAEDLNDMDLGLKNARLALLRVHKILDEQGANLLPQDLKVVSETNRINIDTIRRIRQMDDPDDKTDRDVKTVMDLVLGRRDGLVNDDAN